MKPGIFRTLCLSLLSGIIVISMISTSLGAQSGGKIVSSGSISYAPHVDALVDPNNTVGENKLSLGFVLDGDWKSWRDSAVRRQLAQQAGFKLVRFFTHKGSSPRPCTFWNESTDTGVFDWSDVDSLVQRIFEIGAEPLICLGGCNSAGMTGLPAGMTTNSTTGLAYPESWAAYCAAWVKHFKTTGAKVRFYEIINEPQCYFAPAGWTNINMARLGYFAKLFNSARASMQQQNPAVMVSFDFITYKTVLDYWLKNGYSVDTLNFHKYDDFRYPGSTDDQMLGYAESKFFGPWPLGGNSIMASQKAYLTARGKLLPIINSESNLNSAYENGTDPRIQQMAGAVWLALVLRMDILNGVSYNAYYAFSSSRSYGASTPTGGPGFGMINRDDDKPWYPYYLSQMIGENLAVNDEIIHTECSSGDIKTVAWTHEQTLNVLLVCKADQSQTVQFSGLTGRMNMSKIDNGVSWKTPRIQTSTIDAAQPLTLNGYTVALLQMPVNF